MTWLTTWPTTAHGPQYAPHDTYLAARRTRRQEETPMSDPTDRIRAEADQATRPGQMDRLNAIADEVERLARWKAEALPVLDGLQELGKALGLPLGEQITGPKAAEEAAALLARAEKAEADLAAAREAKREIERQFRELRSESRILPCDGACTDYPEEDCSRHGREPAELWHIIAEIQAQRDEAWEALARVEALVEEYEQSDGTISHRLAGRRFRAALALTDDCPIHPLATDEGGPQYAPHDTEEAAEAHAREIVTTGRAPHATAFEVDGEEWA